MTDTNTPTTLPKPEHRRESDGVAIWLDLGCWVHRPDDFWLRNTARATLHPLGTRYNPTPYDAVDWSSDERPPVWVRLPKAHWLWSRYRQAIMGHSRWSAASCSRGSYPDDRARYAIETVCGEHVGRLVWWRGDEPGEVDRDALGVL